MDMVGDIIESNSYDICIKGELTSMKIIQLAIKHCKKIISVLLIAILLVCPTKSFADNYKLSDAEKECLIKQARVVDQKDFSRVMKIGTKFILVDYYTGTWVAMERTMGSDKHHSDCEPIDKEAGETLKRLYKDREDWKRRPVLIVFEDGSVFCGSSFIVGHCGVDSEPFLKYLNELSGGYKNSENYDRIKGNSMDGHICVHVRKSVNHFDGKINKKHQSNIDKLEDIKSKLK